MKTDDYLTTPNFVGFPKMARLFRDCVITEKIDGTNAQVYITPDGDIYAGSRNRWITPEDDNFGFARWVEENKQNLMNLGPGRHFGEWFGQGIQRGYGLKERRFALFNTLRWIPHDCEPVGDLVPTPSCCGVVPILYGGPFSERAVHNTLQRLTERGSWAVPGFPNPEGIVIYMPAARVAFKYTADGDGLTREKGEKR